MHSWNKKIIPQKCTRAQQNQTNDSAEVFEQWETPTTMQEVVHKLPLIQTALLKPTESLSSAVDKLFAQSIGGSIRLLAVIQYTYTAFLHDSIAISVRNYKYLRMLIEQGGHLRWL